jgi:pentose-5-phosphate-3-epimerase
MDLQLYYQKIREFAATIEEEFPIVVSQETADGGKTGTLTEVAARLGAKMVVEGTARLAKPKEAEAFRQVQAERKRVADQEAAASKVQLTVLSTDDLNRLKGITQ